LGQLTVLVEKEQIALLATEAVAFLDRIADEYPEDAVALPAAVAELQEPTVPLFRARLIGLGFDPERELVLIALREHTTSDDEPARHGGCGRTAAGIVERRVAGRGRARRPRPARGLQASMR